MGRYSMPINNHVIERRREMFVLDCGEVGQRLVRVSLRQYKDLLNAGLQKSTRRIYMNQNII